MIAKLTKQAQLTANCLTILEVEAWCDVLTGLAQAQGLWVQLENRYQKSAYIISPRTGKRIGRIWVSAGIIWWDLISWPAQFLAAPTMDAALASMIDYAVGF